MNKYGLSRTIPADVAREIRRRSGFGCVFCGAFICDYEHIDPVFRDAKVHDAGKMCLVCPGHHRKITNRILSKQDVWDAYKQPTALSEGFATESITLKRPCTVSFGAILFENPTEILKVDHDTLLALSDDGDRVTIDGRFFNGKGKEVLRIEESNFKSPATNWDVEWEGRSLVIRNGPADIVLGLEIIESTRLNISHLNFHIPGLGVQTLRNGRLQIVGDNGVTIDNFEATTRGPLVVNRAGLTLNGPSTISGGTSIRIAGRNP